MNLTARALEVDSKVIALRHPKKETSIEFHKRAGYLLALLHGGAQESAHAHSMLHANSLPVPQEDQPT